MTSSFCFIDLFAGVGGFHLAMSRLGGECVWASEIDGDAAKIYERNFEFEPFGDIREATQRDDDELRRLVPEHDVLCAGFPCQPFSKSGFQRGISETRGTLFYDILRILEIRRPRYVILENVRNLAGPRQRNTWNTVIDNLRRLGYRVAGEPAVFSPHLLPPENDGRPQVRDRVFILGEYVGLSAAKEDCDPLVDRQPVDDWNPDRWRIEDWLQEDDQIGSREDYELRPDELRWMEAWNAFVKRIDNDTLPGFPIWVDAFTPEPAIKSDTPRWKARFLERNSAFYVEHQATLDAWVEEFNVLSFPASRRKFEWQARKHQPYQADRDLWDLVAHMRPSGIRVKPPTYLPALVAITQTSIIGSRRRRITPREAARLQGFPDTYELHPDDTTAYKQFGNAVNVGAVMHVARALLESHATC